MTGTCITYSTDYYQLLTVESWFTNLDQTPLNRSQQLPAPYKRLIREFKIRRLRTTATVKHATAHDQNHVTVHFSHAVQRLRWVVELFRVLGTTENILVVFCRFGNSRISSFRKNVFNSPALSEREAKYVSCVLFLLRFTLLIHCCDYVFI